MRRVVKEMPREAEEPSREPKTPPRISRMLPPAEEDLEVHVVSAVWAARDCVGAELLENIERLERGQATPVDPIRALENARQMLKGAVSMLTVLSKENPKKASEALITIGERAIASTDACYANLVRATLFQTSLHPHDEQKRQKAWRIVRRSQENTQSDVHVWLAALAESFPEACDTEE